jgi:cytoskeletal protein CcmA (bactofilin family)
MFDSPRYHPAIQPIPRILAASKGGRDRDVEIGGSFDGTFDGRSITILKGASVTGELGAEMIEIHGVVRGKIRGTSIHIRTTGLVEGEMEYETLSVDPGATINARCTPS